jgi:hypothetical protein
MDVEVAPTVPDTQSVPNEVVGDCWYKLNAHRENIYPQGHRYYTVVSLHRE